MNRTRAGLYDGARCTPGKARERPGKGCIRSLGQVSPADFPHAKARRTRRKELVNALQHFCGRKSLQRGNSDFFAFFAASCEQYIRPNGGAAPGKSRQKGTVEHRMRGRRRYEYAERRLRKSVVCFRYDDRSAVCGGSSAIQAGRTFVSKYANSCSENVSCTCFFESVFREEDRHVPQSLCATNQCLPEES